MLTDGLPVVFGQPPVRLLEQLVQERIFVTTLTTSLFLDARDMDARIIRRFSMTMWRLTANRPDSSCHKELEYTDKFRWRSDGIRTACLLP